MSQRKVVQIAASTIPEILGVRPASVNVVALTDDGEVWLMETSSSWSWSRWDKLPPIPQDGAA
jgi:hypothetical protein